MVTPPAPATNQHPDRIPVRTVLLAAALVLLASAPAPASGLGLQGPVTHVRDGDTIEVAGIPVRLSGVTADELGTARGEAAAAFMRDMVRGEVVTCALTGETTHDRQVGRCSIDGEDFGIKLIAARLAGRCARYDPDGFYRIPQQDAGPYTGLMPAYCIPR